MRVALLVRVSTNRQDYDRQIVELTSHCEKMNWEVVGIFANKVSGAKKNEERQEIIELLDFIEQNDIDKVCVLEISRLGRNTLEALKVIELLNEKGICLYIKNYNLETIVNGKVNSVASLICTILLEIGNMERCTINDRMTSGRNQYIEHCRKSDEAMKAQYTKEISLLKKGLSLRNISAITGTSISTIRKLYKYSN